MPKMKGECKISGHCPEWKKKSARIFLLFAGAVFLLSSVLKTGNVSGFSELIIKYGFPEIAILSPVIVLIELLCGLFLVLGIYPKETSLITVGLLVVFTGAFTYAHIFNDIQDCGCFGSLGSDLPVWVTYLRNAVLVSMLLLAFLWSEDSEEGIVNKLGICAIAFSIACFFAGSTFSIPSSYTGILVPKHPLYGKPVEETAIPQYLNISKDSTYCFYVYSYDCASCINGLNNIKEYDAPEVADHFYGLTVSEDEGNVIHDEFGIGFKEIYIGQALKGRIRTIPAIILVENGIIVNVIEGEVPALHNFRQIYLSNQ